jgi:hypothetical protein
MASAKLTDVKLVLSAPIGSNRKAIRDLEVAHFLARSDFLWQATPATWTAWVIAAKRLHAAVKADRARRKSPSPSAQAEGPGE